MTLNKFLENLSLKQVQAMGSFDESKQLLTYLAKNGVIISEDDCEELFCLISNIIDNKEALSIIGGFKEKEDKLDNLVQTNSFKCSITGKLHYSDDMLPFSCNYYKPVYTGCYMYNGFQPGCHHCEHGNRS